MGLLKEILLLPLAPVRAPVVGVVKLAEIIQQQVDQELNNPARTRRQLEDLEERRRSGEISPDEEKKGQRAILASKIAPQSIDDRVEKAATTPGRQ